MPRFPDVWQLSLLLISIATLTFSFYVPIYTDDIQHSLISARAGYDGWSIISATPLCSNSFGTEIPITLLPGRTLAWLMYVPISTPAAMRLLGIALLMFWIWLLSWISSKSFNVPKLAICPLIISMSLLGVLPFMGIMIRPETSLAIAVTFYAFLPLCLQDKQLKPLANSSLLICYLLISSWFFSTHPKTIFFFPLALYSLYLIRKRNYLWPLSFGVMLCIIVQAYIYWSTRFNCPDSPWTKHFFQSTALQLSLLSQDPILFIQKFFVGLQGSIVYLKSVVFASKYGSGWLPPRDITSIHSLMNSIIGFISVGTVLFWLASIARIVISAIKKKHCKPVQIIPLVLFSCLILTTGFQQIKNFYDVMFVWFSGCCLTVMLLNNSGMFSNKKWQKIITNVLISISVASQLLLIYTFQDLPDINHRAHINGSLRNQPMSTSALDYENHRDVVISFAKACDILPENNNEHLLIDMFTYLPFRESYRPVFVKHLDNEVIAFAKSHHSSGIITLCSSLPPNVQNISIKAEGLCCIGKGVLNEQPY